ncbi:MAG TPA: GTPase ObgE, partial [Chloroflexota bacterium]|nr:GTPase ObgE [Chloroflexota bacterium]
MFYDFAKIHVAAGKGGDGAMHMHRAKYVPRGGPDGGDGGRGGSIYLLGDSSQHTLLSFRFKRLCKGEPGKPGGAAKRHGSAGGDMTITVPIGTVVRDVESGEEVADILHHGQRVLVARGGKGGLGNVH